MASNGISAEECNTKEPARKITAINKDTVHKICSGQVVLNLAIAVKELVENSLDAGATIVEVRLKEYGQDLIEVIDNGSGVEEENFSGLTLKYHTSKISEFSDLLGVSTFGFRGEALSSLCALSDLVITTRHSSTELGTKVVYDYKGHIKDMTPCARQVGTTVTLSNLFSPLPVRQKEFHRNIKREFNKMTQLLYAYCLVSEGKKIICTNLTSKGNKSVVVATQGSSLRDNIASVFGVRQLQTLLDLTPIDSYSINVKENFFSNLENEKIGITTSQDEVDQIDSEHELDLSEESSNDATHSKDDSIDIKREHNLSTKSNVSEDGSSKKRNNKPFDFNGIISSCAHDSGRSTTDRQFFYVNSRPCEPQKVMRIVNEVYKQYNPHQCPFVFLDLKVKRSSVDVNVTPDKRKIFLDREKCLIDVIKQSLHKIYEKIPATFKMENISNENTLQKPCVKNNVKESTPRIFSSFLSQFAKKPHQTNELNVPKINIDVKRKGETLDNYVSVKVIRTESPEPIIKNEDLGNIETENDNFTTDHAISKDNVEKHSEDRVKMDISQLENNVNNEVKETVYLNYSDDVSLSQVMTINEYLKESHTVIEENKPKRRRQEDCSILQSEIKKKPCDIMIENDSNKEQIKRRVHNTNISIEMIKSLALEDIKNKERKRCEIDRVKFRTEINPVFNKKCEEELKKSICKDMFPQMKIIGQFNLGFIITQFEEDLFIVDQHATDEKYNYETLQKTTILTNQRLVVPQNLELTGVNERILMDNLEICQKNGFTFEIDENASPTKRVKLLTIPISKNYVFGKGDIEELLFMLKDAPNEICRPSRVQTMFASRACRKSVMIGTALSKSTMRKLIDHMGEIEQPWNCPHGRPTIRHLINMGLTQ